MSEHLCLTCANALIEIPEDVPEEERKILEQQVRDVTLLYTVVVYCKALKAIVVGNPGSATQIRKECKHYVKRSS